VSGMTIGELYEELRLAIIQQTVPTSVQPHEWTFSTIVNGYNAHPVVKDHSTMRDMCCCSTCEYCKNFAVEIFEEWGS
jgi:hypothetical protein